jgi:phosphoribulokinase
VNRLKTKAANARKDAAIALAMAKLDANAAALDRHVELFGSQRNALEYLRWMFSRAGRTGKAKAAKLLDKLLAGSQR